MVERPRQAPATKAKRTRAATIVVSFLLCLVYVDVLTSTVACTVEESGDACQKDSDCKGDRICDNGKCVSPDSGSQADSGTGADSGADAAADVDLPDSQLADATPDGDAETDAPLTDAPLTDSDLPDAPAIDAAIDAPLPPVDAAIDAPLVDAPFVDAPPPPVDAAVFVDAPPDA